jgi:glyoxylase-like metal-dependent hydrolase (beta-lactamase superfamily II)
METAGQHRRPELVIERRSLKIGPYDICPVPTGIFGLDGGAMFGTVPKVLWEKSNPPDDKNRIPMEARALLLKSGDRKILVDCGNGEDFVAKYGEKLGHKFAEMYGLDANGPSLKKSLALHGLKFEDITDVILTHLHFDHAGGGTTERGGQLVPTFPNATYYVQKANFDTAANPNIREKASYFASNFEPLLKSGKLKLLDGNIENLLPGISVMVSNGHTIGQQVVKVSDGQQSLMYCGDVVPTSSHVRLAWVMGYDLEPLRLIEEKKNFLGPAADQQWYLYFEHDPYCDAAQIMRAGSDFAVSKRFQL